MFDLREYTAPKKLYGNVKKGWHFARIYQAALKNGRSKAGKSYQYILVDFLIVEEDVLVPFYTYYKQGQEKPDPVFGRMLSIIGLSGDFSDDKAGFFKAMIGSELMVKVVHRFKGPKRIRRDQVVDFSEEVPF